MLLSPWFATPATPPQETRLRRSNLSLLRELRKSEDFVSRGSVADALLAKGRSGQKKLATAVADQLEDLEERYTGLRAEQARLYSDYAIDWRVRELSPEDLEAIASARATLVRVLAEAPGRIASQGELDRAIGLLSFHLEADLERAREGKDDLSRTSAALAEVIDLAEEYRRYWASSTAHLEDGGRDDAWLAKAGDPPDPAGWRIQIDADLGAARRVAWRLNDGDRAVLAANQVTGKQMQADELEAVLLISRLRYLAGLPLLRIVPGLNRACRNHAEDMIEHGFHSHVSPVPGRRDFWDRAAEEGVPAQNENLNEGSCIPSDAVRSWWRSYGHRRALMGPYTEIGLVHRAPNWVSLFN